MDKNKEILERILNDQVFRRALVRKSFFWFFHTYFSHYISFPTADFHKEIFNLLENQEIKTVGIVAFRGSAKSTIASLAYPIWAMIGEMSKKYVLLISQTQGLSRQILTNIKQEFETNELLIKDFGPFIEIADEWRANSLVIPQFGTRITAISASESIRGLRHRQHRPDLTILDDVEDLETVKTKEGRDKSWIWFTGEVIPIGDNDTKLVCIGNMLHEDSLMMKIKQNLLDGTMNGEYREYPLIDSNRNILWKPKFPSQKEINNLKSKVPNDSAWHREYLLEIIAEEDRVVKRDWIKYYTDLPDIREFPPRLLVIGIDLAISEKSTADFTTLVPAYVTGYGKNLHIYILPYIKNKRLTFPQTIEEIKRLCDQLYSQFNRQPIVYVENVAYQTSVVQQLVVEKLFAEPVNVAGLDKRSRLSITTPYIQTGKVLFPRHGAEDLISQITNFGIEKHDDLADGFSTMMLKVSESDLPTYESFESLQKSVDDTPIYRNFGDGPVDVSKPFFTMDMEF